MKIAILAGDGIGPEIVAQAVRVLEALKSDGLKFEMESGLLGGCAVDATGEPFPEVTRRLVADADAVILGAVGGRSMIRCRVSYDRREVCSAYARH